MTKSELIALLTKRQSHLLPADVNLATRHILAVLSDALAHGGRIEVRGFGSFSVRYRRPRPGRNPKTGAVVALPGTYLPHFKAGKELRLQVARGSVGTNPG